MTALGETGRPVAYLFDLPLTFAEAHAFAAIEGGYGTPDQKVLFMAWVVKMSIVHGSWIVDATRGMIEAHVPDLTCP
jgi:hypothetical protein